MQRGSSSSELTASILAKIVDRNLTKINLAKSQWRPIDSWFRYIVHCIHEYAHPLGSRAVSVNCPTRFARGLYLNAVLARLDRIAGVFALDDEIWMSVKVSSVPTFGRGLSVSY